MVTNTNTLFHVRANKSNKIVFFIKSPLGFGHGSIYFRQFFSLTADVIQPHFYHQLTTNTSANRVV